MRHAKYDLQLCVGVDEVAVLGDHSGKLVGTR